MRKCLVARRSGCNVGVIYEIQEHCIRAADVLVVRANESTYKYHYDGMSN